jgi:hypothetical protein
MMKPLLTVLLCLIFLNCNAQRISDSLFFMHMRSRKISLSEKKPDSIFNFPFQSVKVWDARADTSSIGFLKYLGGTCKLLLKKGLSNSLTDFINSNYGLSNDSNNLLIIIKEFRITNYAAINEMKDINIYTWNSGAVISAELFLQTGNIYRALYKTDSIQIASFKSETAAQLAEEGFRLILKKSENKNLSEMHIGKTAFSFSDIEKHVSDFTNFPILNATTLNKGAYKNFNEFKTNNPSIRNFEIKKGYLSDELFVTEHNQSYPLHDFWGYCDGKNVFIYSAKNLFKLIKSQNTYNIKGIKSLSKTEDIGKELAEGTALALIGISAYPQSENSSEIIKANVTAFQLNMQNGELY